MSNYIRVKTKKQWQEVCIEHLTQDWHEPDERNIRAEVMGSCLDNAGFWGRGNERSRVGEFWIRIERFDENDEGAYRPENLKVTVDVNIANLLEWAGDPR